MTNFVLITDGVVVQRQPYAQDGFIEAPDDVVCGMLFDGETFSNPPPVEPPPAPPPSGSLFATAGFVIAGGALVTTELAAAFLAVTYEDGWMQLFFHEEHPEPYLVFVQTDTLAKVEQFKSAGSFELVFSDAEGLPINPGRIDLQILKAR